MCSSSRLSPVSTAATADCNQECSGWRQASNVSHELRTALAAILGYAELAQDGFYELLGQDWLDALSRIRSNGKMPSIGGAPREHVVGFHPAVAHDDFAANITARLCGSPPSPHHPRAWLLPYQSNPTSTRCWSKTSREQEYARNISILRPAAGSGASLPPEPVIA